MNNYYDYTGAGTFKSLYHLINQYTDPIGIELGLYRAISFCSLLDACPHIKLLHGVDNWQPYKDEKYINEDGVVDIKDIEISKQLALHNIKYCRNNSKAIIHESNTKDIVYEFEDNYFDFILIDSYMTEKDVEDEIKRWWPKIKNGGIFAGHDWDTEPVQNVVIPYFNKLNYRLSVYDNVWMCIK